MRGRPWRRANDPQSEVSQPTSLAVGEYPHIYFTSQGNNRIGRRQVGEPCIPTAPNTIRTFADPQGEVAGPTDIVYDDEGVMNAPSYRSGESPSGRSLASPSRFATGTRSPRPGRCRTSPTS